MHIGVDATCWANRRGYGRFTRALMTAVSQLDRGNEYTFFVDHESEQFPLPSGLRICRIHTKTPTITAASADGRRSLSDLWAVAQAVRRARVDLIYFPTDYTYVPFFMGVPRIVTIHDAIAELYPEMIFPTLRSKVFYRAKIRSGVLQARMLITVSEYSSRLLREKLKIPQSRLRIVSEAADSVFRPLDLHSEGGLFERWGTFRDGRYICYVGGFSPHKNLFMLLEVFAELAARINFQDLRLLLIGDYSGDSFYSCYKELAERVRAQHLENRVVFTGRLDDKDLVTVLNRSEALILPSFCEGFGLPAVEAAACGTPVIVTSESPLPGLLGEGALVVAPRDKNGWIRAIERLLADARLRTRMSQAGLVAARRLTWQRSAQQLLAVFDEVHRDVAAA